MRRQGFVGFATIGAWACLAAAAPPGAKEVYRADFQGGAGPEWSLRRTDGAPRGDNRRFLGRFGSEAVTLRLAKLPAHRFVTVRFELPVLDTWDGDELLTGCGALIGPDQWGLRVAGGPTLIHTSFNNVRKAVRRNSPQAYPSPLRHGTSPSRTKAAESNTLGCSTASWYGDSVYRLRYTFPHRGEDLRLVFYGLNLQSLDDESWGLDNVRVTLSASYPSGVLTAEELRRRWAELLADDPAAAEQAVWDLACAGERTLALIDRKLAAAKAAPGDAERVKKLIAELDHDEWAVRRRATAALTEMGARAVPALRWTLRGELPPEARARVETILAKVAPADAAENPRALRRRRIVRVLELLGTEAAKERIRRLTGAPAGVEALQPGSRWEGVRRSREDVNHPMVLEVQARRGRSFRGVLHWPKTGHKRLFAGTIGDNRIELTEGKLAGGQGERVPASNSGRVVGQMLTGSWRPQPNGPGGGFELHLADRDPERPQ